MRRTKIVALVLLTVALGAVALAGALAMLGLGALNEKLSRQPLEAMQLESRTAGRFADQSITNAEVARALRNVVCVGPKAAAAGFQEPSLVFMTGTSTLLTDGSGAADFLGQGSCRFALVEARSERAFAQRAEAIGLRYNVATRVDGYNISQGKAISIAIFRSAGTE